MKSIFPLLFVLFSHTVISQQKNEPTLKFGDPAPPIHVMKWAKSKGNEVKRFTPGQPINFEPGKVYVVEFWGTWCGPCIASMPHLSELARKYAGKVTVLSIDIWEQSYSKNPNYEPKVQAFVDQKGDGMDYNVGIDDPGGIMSKTWFGAMNHIGTPYAYVITKDSKIMWGGHPLGGMEEAIEYALADKLDLKKSTELMKANDEMIKKWADLNGKARKAINAKEYSLAKASLDEMDKLEPDLECFTRGLKYQVLANTDADAAHSLADKHFKHYYRHDKELLEIASIIVNTKGIVKPDYPMALKMLQRAKEVQPSPNPRTIEMLAKTYSLTGDFMNAVKTQEELVKLTQASGKGVDEGQKQLEIYKGQLKN